MWSYGKNKYLLSSGTSVTDNWFYGKNYVYHNYVSAGASSVTAISISDVMTGTETTIFVKNVFTVQDSGVGSDVINELKAFLNIQDTGLGSDDLAIIANLFLSDDGSGADSGTFTKGGVVYKTLQDSGIGVDSISIRAILSVSDSGTGADSDEEKAIMKISDTGSGITNINVKALLKILDSGVNLDTVNKGSAAYLIQELGTFVDQISVVGNEGVTEKVYFYCRAETEKTFYTRAETEKTFYTRGWR